MTTFAGFPALFLDNFTMSDIPHSVTVVRRLHSVCNWNITRSCADRHDNMGAKMLYLELRSQDLPSTLRVPLLKFSADSRGPWRQRICTGVLSDNRNTQGAKTNTANIQHARYRKLRKHFKAQTCSKVYTRAKQHSTCLAAVPPHLNYRPLSKVVQVSSCLTFFFQKINKKEISMGIVRTSREWGTMKGVFFRLPKDGLVHPSLWIQGVSCSVVGAEVRSLWRQLRGNMVHLFRLKKTVIKLSGCLFFTWDEMNRAWKLEYGKRRTKGQGYCWWTYDVSRAGEKYWKKCLVV